jgi:uncharacterized protein YbjT (DUF2867 family)
MPPNQPPAVAVTGATGRLGGRIARRLAELSVPQLMLVRDPSRAPQLPSATAHQAGFTDRAAIAEGLKGIQTVLMVSASETPDRLSQHKAFVDAVAESDAQHVVYISFVNAAPDATFTLARDHWATEEHLRGSGLAYTFLRDNFYADFMPALIGTDDVIRGPAGQGRVAAVAQDDIAEAAAHVLANPAAHAHRTYDLTGPHALTLDDVAAELTAATGRSITYHPETVDEAYDSRRPSGEPQWQLDAWVSTYTAIAAGELEHVSSDVPTLIGRPATALSDLLSRGESTY